MDTLGIGGHVRRQRRVRAGQDEFDGNGRRQLLRRTQAQHQLVTVDVPEQAQANGGVTTTTVESRVIPTTIEVTGSVQPDSAQVAHIRPLARGVIESLAVKLGSRVAPGQPLLAYDNIEMGTLTGEYLSEMAAQRQAESDLEVRQLAVERAEELFKLEAIAQQTLELRRAEVRNAQAARCEPEGSGL